MKVLAAAMTAILVMGGAAMAQSSNATVQGTQTAPSNGSGSPGATAPTGQVSTTVTGSAGTTTTTPSK